MRHGHNMVTEHIRLHRISSFFGPGVTPLSGRTGSIGAEWLKCGRHRSPGHGGEVCVVVILRMVLFMCGVSFLSFEVPISNSPLNRMPRVFYRLNLVVKRDIRS